jgi:chitinase
MCGEALGPLTQVTEASPRFALAHFELGACERKLGNPAKALVAYEKAFELDPKNADAAYNAGLILFETSRIDEALVRFEQGLALKPNDPDLLDMAARCYIHQANYERAVELLEKARAATADPAKAAFLDELIRKIKAGIKSPDNKNQENKGPAPGRVIIGYVFPRDRVIEPAEIAADKLTHVNYAFVNVEKGVAVEAPKDAEHLRALTGLRARHPHFKVLVSAGGWTWSGGFSEAAATAESRARFVASAVDFVRRHDLDGFDVDWEYPGLPGNGNPHGPQDKANFTRLMAELRATLDQEGRARGRPYLLTMAAGAFPRFLEQTEMERVAASVDFVNLMTYDFRIAGSDPLAGHHANLYRHPQDADGNSADGAVRDFIAAGVPARKLVLGVPFYGRAWGGVRGDAAAHGLYQPGGPLVGEPIETSYEKLNADLVGRNGFGRHWDAVSQAPYLWNPERSIFVSYEDPESLRIKCRYIRDKGLAGSMFWEYFADRSGALLGTLFEELRTNEDSR